MSTDALDVYASHLQEITKAQFANEFLITGGSTFQGIFDYSPDQSEKDSGNVDQKQRKPRIIVSAIPAGLDIDDEITNVYTGEVFHVQYFGKDDMGAQNIWLY